MATANPFDRFSPTPKAAGNVFDAFDAPAGRNPFDAFDTPEAIGPEDQTRPTGRLRTPEVQSYTPPGDQGVNPPSQPETQGTTAVPGTVQTQDFIEIPKGIPAGAITGVGTAMKGAGAATAATPHMRRYIFEEFPKIQNMTPGEITGLHRKVDSDPQLSQAEKFGLHTTIGDVAADFPSLAEIQQREYRPTTGTPLYQSGQAVQDYGRSVLPPAPGFEASPGRQLGEGLGSMATGLAASAVGGPAAGAALFTLMGSGEAVERAVEAGASEEEILKAGRMGTVPGSTDAIPIETLMGRVPLPGGKFINVAKNALGPTLKKIARIGWQAFVEGVQEGGQEFLQNLIAKETYKPEQRLGENVLPSGGTGGAVGAVAETGRLALKGFAGRRGGGISSRPHQGNVFDAFDESTGTPSEPVPQPTETPVSGATSPNPVPEPTQPEAGNKTAPTVAGTPEPGAPPVGPETPTIPEPGPVEGVSIEETTPKATKDAVLSELDRYEREISLTPWGQAQQYGFERAKAAKSGGRSAAERIRNYMTGFNDVLTGKREVTTGKFGPQTGLSGLAAEGARDAHYYASEHGLSLPLDRPANLRLAVKRPSGGSAAFDIEPVFHGIEAVRKNMKRRPQRTYGMGGRPSDTDTDFLPGKSYAGAGVRYTGFVADKVEGESRSEPLRRESVLGKLAKDLGVPLYQGRIQGKKTLGFFRRPIEEVRVKNPADIETAAHEYGHLLDFRYPAIRKQWLPASNANKTVRDELRGISYDANKLYEGFAEYMRLRLTQPAQAAAKAPTFHKWFEGFLDRNEFGKAIREAEKGMTDYFGQDAISRARSKIGTPPEINEFLNPFWDRFRQSVSDDLHGIYRMERELNGAPAPVGAYETARLTRGASSIVEGSLLYGAPVVNADGSHSFKGKGLQQILDPVSDNLDDALLYFVGKSAQELSRQGREKLFTKAEIDGMLSLRTNARETAFSEYQTWNRAILDFAQAKGIINPAFRAQWKRTQYLPFHRVGQPGAHEAVPGAWSGIKALTGGSDNLRDILGNIVGNASMLIKAGLVNEARIEVAKLAKREGGAKFMAEIPKEDRGVKVHRDEVERAILEALGVKNLRHLDVERQKMVDEIVNGMSPMVWLTLRGQAPKGPDIVAVLRQGKPEFYQVADPILYRALVALNRPTQNFLVKLFSIPRRIGQASITLSLDFMAANVARDTLMGTVMSRHGFKPILDSARGLKSRIATDQNYRDYIANGGGFASYLVDEESFKRHLEHFYRSRGINFDTVLHSPAKVLLGLERIADAFEQSTRLGEFRRANETGSNARHAAYSAREVSTDFGMRGDSRVLAALYDTVIFLKAGVNGVDRLYRGVAHDPNRVAIMMKTAAIAGASMALYALNAGNPLYDELEDWDRDTNWHIFLPKPAYYDFVKKNGREPRTAEEAGPLFVHMRWPKIWELGALASLAERGLAQFMEDNAGNYAEHAWRIVRDVFRFEYIPQAVAPVVENFANRNRFLDRPIETQTERDMQPWARSGPYSSRTLRAYGENVARHLPKDFPDFLKSPKQIEALLRGYLGTWAMYGLTASDAMFFDDQPDLRLDQYPGLRRFYRQSPARNTKYITQLYDAIDESVKARRTMRFMDRTYRPELATGLENTPENLAYGPLQKAQKQMGAIRRDMANVQDAPTLKAVQELVEERDRSVNRKRRAVPELKRQGIWNDLGKLKRWMMDDLTIERNKYARDVMGEVRNGQVIPFTTAKQRREAMEAR